MRAVVVCVVLIALSGCGVESASSLAAVGKLKADEAKQGKENMDAFKASLNAATKASEERAEKTEEAGK